MMGQQPKRRNRKGRQMAGLLSAPVYVYADGFVFCRSPLGYFDKKKEGSVGGGRKKKKKKKKKKRYIRRRIYRRQTNGAVRSSISFFLLILFSVACDVKGHSRDSSRASSIFYSLPLIPLYIYI
jgi:hypothetical protein